jgi:hypothetical protein
VAEDARPGASGYAVAVALAPAVPPAESITEHGSPSLAGPGFDDTSGGRRRRIARAPEVVLEHGEDAVRRATEALAEEIGVTARRVAASIETSMSAPDPTPPGLLQLEAVEVTFGITLSAGVQALFTAQGESSVQVTITLSRRP